MPLSSRSSPRLGARGAGAANVWPFREVTGSERSVIGTPLSALFRM
jgi:hypothetical protein